MDPVVQKLKALGCDGSRDSVNDQLNQLKQKKRGNAEEAARDVQEKFVDFSSLLTCINRMISLTKSIDFHSEKFSALTEKSMGVFSDVIARCKARDQLQLKYDQAMQHADFFKLSDEMASCISLVDYIASANQEDLRMYLQYLISLKNKYFYLDMKAASKVELLSTVLTQLGQQNAILGENLNMFLTRIDIKKLEDSNISSIFGQNAVATKLVPENSQILNKKLMDFAPRFETLLYKFIVTEEIAFDPKISLSTFGKLCSYGYTFSGNFKDVFSDAIVSDVFPFSLSLTTALPWDVRYGLVQRISFTGMAGLLSEEILRLILLIIYNQIVFVFSLNYICIECTLDDVEPTLRSPPDSAQSTLDSPQRPPMSPLSNAGSSISAIKSGLISSEPSPIPKQLSNSLVSPGGTQQNIYCWSDFLLYVGLRPKELIRTQNMCYIGPILDQKQIQIPFAKELPLFEQIGDSSFSSLILQLLHMSSPISTLLASKLQKPVDFYFATMRYFIDGLGFLVRTIPGLTQGIVAYIVNLLLKQIAQFVTTRRTDIIIFNSICLDALNAGYHLLDVLGTLGAGYSSISKGAFQFISSLEASVLKSYLFTAQSVARSIGICSVVNPSAILREGTLPVCSVDSPEQTPQMMSLSPTLKMAKGQSFSADVASDIKGNAFIPLATTVRNDAAYLAYDYGILRHIYSIYTGAIIKQWDQRASNNHTSEQSISLCILAILSLLEHATLFVSRMKSSTVEDLIRAFLTIIQGYMGGAIFSLHLLNEYQSKTSSFELGKTRIGVLSDAQQPNQSNNSLHSLNFEALDKSFYRKLFAQHTAQSIEASLQQLITDSFIIQRNLLPLLASKFDINIELSASASLLGQLFLGVSLLDELQYSIETASSYYSADAIMEIRSELDTSQLVDFSLHKTRQSYAFARNCFSAENKPADYADLYSFDESGAFFRACQSTFLVLNTATECYLEFLLYSVFSEIDELVLDIRKPKSIALSGVTYSSLNQRVAAALHKEATETIVNPGSIEFTPLINQIFSVGCLHNVLVAVSRIKNKLVQNKLIDCSSMWLGVRERIVSYLKYCTCDVLPLLKETNYISFVLIFNFLFKVFSNREMLESCNEVSEIQSTLELVSQTLQLKFKRLLEA